MPSIPRDRSLDSTLALQLDPYGFIAKRCQRYGSEVFQTRIMLQRTLCMSGRDAAELFYNPERFVRKGAHPTRLQATLFGRGSIQTLDGEAHRHRKEMFMSLVTPERVRNLAELTGNGWRSYAQRWAAAEQVILYNEMRELLCRAVCEWAGVPLREAEVRRRTWELSALFDQATLFGPGHWAARRARKRSEAWAEDIIEQVRAGQMQPPEGSAARVIAMHRELNGRLLSRRIAAAELLNVLRPTVAVAVFITFCALALHRYPECRARLQAGEDEYVEWFVQEVRRYFPFFPSIAARVRQDFEWKGYRFPRGRRTLLDLYGTNHDARVWEEPDAFRPERFQDWVEDPFALVPQGGGDHLGGHRCTGEGITIELMKVATAFLTRQITYDVPAQDLRVNCRRLPALPQSRFIMTHIREQAGSTFRQRDRAA